MKTFVDKACRILNFSAFLFSILLVSCSEEETPPLPDFVLNITSPSGATYVKGTVNIAAEAESVETAISSAKIYIDNILVQEMNGPAINASWDSKTVADGSHSIKITAQDDEGRESTAEVVVSVLNTFITFNIPANYVASGEKVLFFFSDDDGTTLTVVEAKNNTQLVIETPANLKPGSSLVLSRFSIGTIAGDQILSYADFKPGTYNLKPLLKQSSLGSHRVDITGVPVTTTTVATSSATTEWSRLTDTNGGDQSINVPLTSDPGDIFVSYTSQQQTSPSYRLLNNVSISGTSSVALNTFIPMDLTELTAGPSSTFSMSQVSGLPGNDLTPIFLYENFAVTGIGDPTKLRMFYPGASFPKYVFTNIYSAAPWAYKNQHVAATAPTSFTPINADISSVSHSNGRVTVTTAGTCDYTMLTAASTFSGRSYSWQIFVPSGQSKVVAVPKIPAEIKLLTTSPFETLTWTTGIITDYETLDGYPAYIQFIFNTPDKHYLSFKEKNKV
jgi:hypothetical protein